MRNQNLIIFYLSFLLILLLSACSMLQDDIQAISSSAIPAATHTPQPTQTSTPNPTPTPIPTQEFDYDCSTSNELSGVDLYFEDGKLARMGNGRAYGIDWSTDGSMIAIGAETGLYIINAYTMEKILFIDTGNSVSHLLFSPNGKWIATDYGTGAIKNDAEIQNKQTMEYHVAVWNSKTGDLVGVYGENINTIGIHEDINREIFSFSHDSQHITFGTRMTTNKTTYYQIEVWNITTNEMMQSWKTTELTFPLPQFAPDNNYIVSAWEDGIAIFDFDSGTEMDSFSEYSGYATIFLDSDHIVVHEMKSGNFFLLNIRTRERKFLSSSIDAYRTHFLYNEEQLLIYTNENKSPQIQIWDSSSNLNNIISLIEPAIDIQYNAENHEVATMDGDHVLRVWNITNGSLLRSYKFSTLLAEKIYPSQDGTRLITYSNDQFHILDATTGKYICSCEEAFTDLDIVSFSPYGNNFVAISKSGNAKIWNIANGKLVDEFSHGKTMENGFTPNHALAYKTYLPEGIEEPLTYFAWATDQTEIGNWIGKSMKDSSYMTHPSTAISRDGELIAIQIEYKTNLLNINTDQFLVNQFKSGSTPMSFSPNGKQILSSDFYFSSIHIFDIYNINSEKEINLGFPGEGPRFPAKEIVFSENGKYLITYSKFYTKPHIILWDANSWKILKTYDTPAFLEDAQISYDGSLVTSLSSYYYPDYTLYLWHNDIPLSE